MAAHELISAALPPTLAVVRAVRPDQLDLPSPCGEFTVRDLIEHFRQSTLYLVSVTGDAPADPPDGLEERLALVGEVYAKPATWEGEVSFPSGPLPAATVGGMVVTEIVMHGWDLARATGQSPVWDPQVVEFLESAVGRTAGMGRKMGAYGPEVPVPADAPPLDRVLGLTGRDPQWTTAA
ncbi:TIGR03086 family metal-binding protein [Actinoplanes sp. N902-109]|uniref:TIGR03086 family metal-binding protein n=1 Tax=Actinoplanes sp. (strain N902-109) TaxID=649831 RepID=UPI0003293A0A|nr:TIGR03086 family metal-binding protein [Actinoplanes sp. N902-109]AGL20234.1 hypothetical protein L083_6724 [Actinoplanes sp. N902-109]